jgi:hypothetical protein
MRIRINPNRRGSECVCRTPDAFAATVQHVSIDHRRRHLFVTQQLLNLTLQLIVSNSRFLILPWVRVRYLASTILSLCARQLPADWKRLYG